MARIPAELLQARGVVLLDFGGVPAWPLDELRRAARKLGGRIAAVRNQAAAAAIAGTPLAILTPFLRGSTAWFLVDRDAESRCHGILQAVAQLRFEVPVRAVWVEGGLVDGDELRRRQRVRDELEARSPLIEPADDLPLMLAPSPSAVLADAASIGALRGRLAALLEGPPTGHQYQGWNQAAIDVPAVMAEVPQLHLESGWTLQGFAFREGDNGNGVVWAVPRFWARTAAARAFVPGSDLFKAPRPAEARPPEEILRGDGSAAACLQASLLSRELDEYAALWHGASWGDYDIIDGLDSPLLAERGYPPEVWTPARIHRLLSGEPVAPFPLTADLRPRIEPRPDGGHSVVFYTFNGMGQVRISAHLDHYAPASISLQRSEYFPVATGGRGAVH